MQPQQTENHKNDFGAGAGLQTGEQMLGIMHSSVPLLYRVSRSWQKGNFSTNLISDLELQWFLAKDGRKLRNRLKFKKQPMPVSSVKNLYRWLKGKRIAMIKKRVIAVVFMLLFMLLLSLSCAKPSLLPAQAPSQTPVLTTGAADQKTDLGEEQTATANAAARAMSSNETEMALRSTKAAIATADQATQSQLSIEASKTAVEANRQGTQLAKAQTATQNVVSTAQSYKSTSDALEGRMTLKFGPKNGNLLHIPTNNTVEWYVVSISVADFVMEARFFNPDAPKWDYGFAFRRGGTNNQFRFWIRSDKHWYLTYTTGNMADKKNVADGKVPNLNTGAGKSNLVRIVADGETGMLMVNGEWVARFSLADRTGPGGIYIATGFSRGDETKGQLTHYEEFTIWDLK